MLSNSLSPLTLPYADADITEENPSQLYSEKYYSPESSRTSTPIPESEYNDYPINFSKSSLEYLKQKIEKIVLGSPRPLSPQKNNIETATVDLEHKISSLKKDNDRLRKDRDRLKEDRNWFMKRQNKLSIENDILRDEKNKLIKKRNRDKDIMKSMMTLFLKIGEENILLRIKSEQHNAPSNTPAYGMTRSKPLSDLEPRQHVYPDQNL